MLALLIDPDAPPPGPPPVIAATLLSASGQVEADGRSLEAGDEIPTGTIIRSGTGGGAALRMADGVELRLDGGSQIALPGAAIVLVTRGGTYLDTAGRTGTMPIEVRTPTGTARDIGTRFEVRVIDQAMRVRVRDGLVQVESGGETARGGRGTELIARGEGAIATQPAPIAGRDWEWVALASGPLAIEGRTLQDFLDWVAREGGWRVRFANDTLARSAATVILHGPTARLTPEAALRVVLPTCGLSYRIEGDTVIVQ
jgi:ferric-dicitrate binding protein FerR (iron transport regulator)